MQQRRSARTKGLRPHAHVLNGLVGLTLVALFCAQLGVPGLGGASRVTPILLVVAAYLGTCVVVRVDDERGGLGVLGVVRMWWQRLRYVWPSLLWVVVLVACACAVVRPGLLAAMRPDVLPTLGFFMNWTSLLGDVVPANSGSPLAATWLVSVEAQLFCVWVLALALLLRAGKALARRITFALAALSSIWLIAQCVLGGNLLRVSLATDAYACPYFLGAWLAFAFPLGKVPTVAKTLLIRPMGSRNRHLRGRRYVATTAANALGCVSFAGIVALVTLLPEGGAVPQGVGVIAVSLLGVVLCATLIAPGNLLGRVLTLPPLTYLGSRALGLYLWFWPLRTLAFSWRNPTPWYALVIACVATVATAEVTYRLVELPFASAELVSEGPRNTTPYRMATTALVIAIAGVFGARALMVTSSEATRPSEASEARQDLTEAEATSDAGSSSAALGQTDADDQDEDATDVDANSRREDDESDADENANAKRKDDAGDADEDGSSKDDEKTSSSKSSAIDDTTIIHAPSSETRTGKYDPVLIGDSVPGDADWSRLPDALIDSYIGRRPDQALEVARGYLDQDAVGSVVILACFSNTTATPAELDSFAELFGDDRQIYLVGTVNPDGFMDVANANLQEACERHENMHYIDWPAVEEGHQEEYLWADATHLRPEGGVAYVNMVVDAIAQDLLDAGGTTE